MSRAYYQELADTWAAAGRPTKLLIDNEWQLLAFMSWAHSEPRDPDFDGFSEVVVAFYNACLAAMDDRSLEWYDDLLMKRDPCDLCGETYLVENLSLCCECMSTYCWSCAERISKGKAPNGNRLHVCGGEIVG